MDSSTAGKEANHPSITKIRVKTKVDTSIIQTPMGSSKGVPFVVVTSPAQGFSGYSTSIPRSP